MIVTGKQTAEAAKARIGWIVAGALLAGLVLVILVARANPLIVAWEIVESALLTKSGFADCIVRAIPLTLIGLGVALAFRAQVFNIGADGQLIAGCALAIALSRFLPGNPIGMLLFFAIGALGGAVWGGIAGALKARFGASEIIVTIMLNYVALQLLSWLVRGPMQESAGILPRSDRIDSALRLPILFDGTRIHAGLFIALAAVIALGFVMSRTRFGFHVVVLGENKDAAIYAGQKVAWQTFLVLAISGAFAGLAGTVEVAGLYGRLQEGFAPGFGITAIAVALVSRLNPLLIPICVFGFSLLYVGLGAVARGGTVPFPLISIIEATVVLFFLVSTFIARSRRSEGLGA